MKKSMAVVGAGTMGNGIAHTFALHGYDVMLVDQSETALELALKTIHQNLQRQLDKNKITSEQMEKAVSLLQTGNSINRIDRQAQLVVEAVPEQLKLKQGIFSALEAHVAEECILATNTSSISITSIASVVQHSGRVIGMHFMNPVPVMPLVEVIRGYTTTEETLERILKVTGLIEKTPVVVQDYPGFVANKILMPMINEAIDTLHRGIADVKGIDTIMQLGMAHPMGPLKLADYIGLDTCLSILRVLYEGFGHTKYAPSPLLVNMVAAGKLGVKSGEGFYDWRNDRKSPPVAAFFDPA